MPNRLVYIDMVINSTLKEKTVKVAHTLVEVIITVGILAAIANFFAPVFS